jgi:hypothetical protein
LSLYAKAYERALKRYDPDLFVERNVDGVLCVFKHHKRFVPVIDADGFKLYNLTYDKQYVFAITDTWGPRGKQRDYGVDDILHHIQKIDSLANAKFLEEIDEANAKVDKDKDKRLKNEWEGMLAYEKKRMQRAFDTIAPISRGMSKADNKKRLRDRRIKNGNY